MKKSILLLLITVISFKAISQDVIIKNDKSELKVKVMELTDDAIKYKKFEMPDGPVYSVKKTEVFMILYNNGTKEYIENKQAGTLMAAQKNSQSLVSNKNQPESDTEDVGKYKFMGSIAVNDGLNVFDLENNYKIKNNFYFGFSLYSTDGFFNSGGIYPFIAYKHPLTRDFFVWGNAGYNYSYVGGSRVGNVEVPGSSAGGFLWEIGADYFFSKHTGITVYSPEANGFFFGLVFRRGKA